MSPLLYLIRRTLANIIKGLFKKPALLILYILIALASVGMIVFVFLMPSTLVHNADPSLFRMIMTALAVVIFYLSFKQGIEKGGSFFRSSDVALVFTGPFRSNDVLLYGFIRQLGGMVLAMFVAIYQIPNLKNNFALQPYGIFVLMLAVALFALSYPILGMVLYAFTSKTRARRRAANTVLNLSVLALLLLFLYQLTQSKDLYQAAAATLDGDWMFWVPVIGWMRAIASAAIDGIGWQFFVGTGLMVAMIAAFVVILYRLNLDYYEEVLEATEYKEAALAAKKEGKGMQFNDKARRKVRHGLFGQGARALFGKNILELRKSSFLLFFDRTSVIVIIAALAFNFIMPGELTSRMVMVLIFAVYMLFLFQMQGRWPLELNRPFIYTMPARPSRKLFWATMSDHLKNLIDGIALFAIAGGMLGTSPQYGGVPVLTVLACIFCYVALGAVFIYSDVLSRRLFGGVHSKPLAFFLKLFFTIFVISPGIGLMIAVPLLMPEAAAPATKELFSVLGFGLWASAAAGISFAVSSGIFKNLEAGA